jgi:hypothetical protein
MQAFYQKIVFIFLITGILLTILGFLGLFEPVLFIGLFSFIAFLFLLVVLRLLLLLPTLTKTELFLTNLLIFVWLLHFLQVLVPETGFDALWYHLPVIRDNLYAKQIIYNPDLYQSLNPLFSDLFFLTGFAFLGSIGAKLIAYIFAVFLMISSYFLSKIFLNRRLSLATVLLISTFQVVSWQASSFYVDIAKAFWEISGLWLLLLLFKNNNATTALSFVKPALLFSASLGTKLFSIFLAPIFFILFIIKIAPTKQKHPALISKKLLFYNASFIITIFLIPLPYYLFSYLNTSIPFYSFVVHLEKLSQIGGESSLCFYLIERTSTLIISPFYFIIARDYITPLGIIFLILIISNISKLTANVNAKLLLIFSSYQWLLWWYLPPVSTRYALSGFITLVILGVYLFNLKHKSNAILFLILIMVVINLLPRFIVGYRSINYLLVPQTKSEYLRRFYDGNIDDNINDWYFKNEGAK